MVSTEWDWECTKFTVLRKNCTTKCYGRILGSWTKKYEEKKVFSKIFNWRKNSKFLEKSRNFENKVRKRRTYFDSAPWQKS